MAWHVMAFDTHGYRVVRVALPESVVAQYTVGPQEPPDTRASSISRWRPSSGRTTSRWSAAYGVAEARHRVARP